MSQNDEFLHFVFQIDHIEIEVFLISLSIYQLRLLIPNNSKNENIKDFIKNSIHSTSHILFFGHRQFRTLILDSES